MHNSMTIALMTYEIIRIAKIQFVNTISIKQICRQFCLCVRFYVICSICIQLTQLTSEFVFLFISRTIICIMQPKGTTNLHSLSIRKIKMKKQNNKISKMSYNLLLIRFDISILKNFSLVQYQKVALIDGKRTERMNERRKKKNFSFERNQMEVNSHTINFMKF